MRCTSPALLQLRDVISVLTLNLAGLLFLEIVINYSDAFSYWKDIFSRDYISNEKISVTDNSEIAKWFM